MGTYCSIVFAHHVLIWIVIGKTRCKCLVFPITEIRSDSIRFGPGISIGLFSISCEGKKESSSQLFNFT